MPGHADDTLPRDVQKWPNRSRYGIPFRLWTQVNPRKVCVTWGAHWRNHTNTTELSICGGDAAFLSNLP